MNRQELGKFGEEVAAFRLKDKGYRILDQNWRCSIGEIDLIAIHKGCIVFIEVKTRTSDLFGSPEESITYQKQKKMLQNAQYYLMDKKLTDKDWRIDMVAVVCDSRGEVQRFEHYENVVSEM